MAFERRPRLACGYVPEPDHLIPPARGERLAVGREGHGEDPVGVAFEGGSGSGWRHDIASLSLCCRRGRFVVTSFMRSWGRPDRMNAVTTNPTGIGGSREDTHAIKSARRLG